MYTKTHLLLKKKKKSFFNSVQYLRNNTVHLHSKKLKKQYPVYFVCILISCALIKCMVVRFKLPKPSILLT